MGKVKITPKKLHVIYHPDEFSEGVRILMLTTRSKDGGRTNNPDRQTSNKKYVTRSKDEYYQKLDELIEEMNPSQRIYSTVDSRDIDKAIRIFKQRQLDADYYDNESRHGYYIDVFNRWISALQSPEARDGKMFLFDLDPEDGVVDENLVSLVEQIKKIDPNHYIYKYKTKNGYHVVTRPMNPTTLDFRAQQNAMLLVAYYEDQVTPKD